MVQNGTRLVDADELDLGYQRNASAPDSAPSFWPKGPGFRAIG